MQLFGGRPCNYHGLYKITLTIAACAETGESDNIIIENFPYIRINKHNDNETFHYIRHSMPEFSYGVMY